MIIRTEIIAQKLIELGFSSREIDSDEVTAEIIQILAERDLFNLIHEEMTLIEDEKNQPRNREEYLERIGEF
jgi:hypothetical protein